MTTTNTINNNNIYIPKESLSTKDIEIGQRRVLLIGEPGKGKTFTSIMTSPNPIILDYDNGITDPRLIKMGIPHIPLYNDKYVKEVLKKSVKCNGLLQFIKQDGIKLARNQTLILDSLSSLMDDVEKYFWSIAPIPPGRTEPDGYKYWGNVLDYYIELFSELAKLNCHVIVTAHLSEIRDKENGVLKGYGPLVSGSIKQQIGRFFTDVIRQCTFDKKQGDKVTTEYKWQVKPDSMFPAKSRANVDTLYVDANMTKLIEMD